MSLIINGNVLTRYTDDGRKEIVIPDVVAKIGSNAFKDCKLLTSVTIPITVTEISNNAFVNCSSLETINISNRALITYSKFQNCPKVKV